MANIQDLKLRSSSLPKPRNTSEGMLPGLSYIPDKIEVAEDKLLMDKVGHELLDFIRMLTQILDLMYTIKTKHLRNMTPIPHPVIRELTSKKGKGVLFKAFIKGNNESSPTASPSVEAVLKQQSPLHPPRRHPGSKPDNLKYFPFANDLLGITGKKMRPLWQTVLFEKPEEIKLLKKKKPKVDRDKDTSEMYTLCRKHPGITRTSSETDLFSIKFVYAHSFDVIANPDAKLAHQMEMMLASFQGFRTVEEHKAYLSSLESHWYTNFVTDALKIGVITCSDIIKALEKLAHHYDMNYNSLPFAKAKLCLIVMSLPFWDIVRPETQRAVEFILENILLLSEKHLIDWLRVRNVPYVVYPPYSMEDFTFNTQSASDEDLMDIDDIIVEEKVEGLESVYGSATTVA